MEHMDGGLGDEHGRRCRRCGHSVRTKWITLIAFLSQHWRFPTLNHEYFNAAVVGTFATAVGTFYAYQQANEAFQASDEYKVQEAVKKFMSPHQVSEAENIVKREVMEAIKDRVRVWKMKDHATIISGRYMAGKTVAVEEALRGTRGVFRFCIEVADWKSLMYQKLGVKDADMFEQVLRRVRQELAKHPDNLTKFPILLLDIPRETPTGAMSLVSTTAKEFASDAAGDLPAHVMVACSSAASALAFDAGGKARQKDIWVGGLTEDEAKQVVELHGRAGEWNQIKAIVKKCDYRAGDVVKVCDMRKKGISFADIETTYEEVAEAEVVRFDRLTVDGKAVGRQMLQELFSSPEGMKEVVNSTPYPARKIAAEIRNEDAHAVLWHPTKRRYYLASEFHKEAAQTLLKGSP